MYLPGRLATSIAIRYIWDDAPERGGVGLAPAPRNHHGEREFKSCCDALTPPCADPPI